MILKSWLRSNQRVESYVYSINNEKPLQILRMGLITVIQGELFARNVLKI